MKEIRVKGNIVEVEDGKVFIFNNNKPVAQNIKSIFIYHKTSYGNSIEYFLTGSVGFISSKYNRAAFRGVEKIIVDEENNSMEVYI